VAETNTPMKPETRLKAMTAAERNRELVQPSLVLFLTGLIITAILAVVYGITNPIITDSKAREQADSLRRALPAADAFDAARDAGMLAADGFTVPDTVATVFRGTTGGKFAGYAVVVEPKGYGGKMNLIAGIDADGAVVSVLLVSQNETPGLGSRAAEPAFLGQFAGLLTTDGPAVVKKASDRKGDIQALTGATVTSRAVTRGVADALAIAGDLAKKEGAKP